MNKDIEIIDLDDDELFNTGSIKKINNKTKKIKKNKRKQKKSKSKKILIISWIVISIFALGSAITLFLLYGPYNNFKNWLVTTAMTTKSHQYLATWFYSDDMIQKVLMSNQVVESGENTNTDLIKFVNYDSESKIYKNKYEKEVLTKDKNNDSYKLININENGLRGYLVVIYDASKVKVASSKMLGTSGQMLTTIAKNNNALIAMNASGFYDPEYNSNGGMPHGLVIQNEKVVADNVKSPVGGGIIGFDKKNKLVLSRMTKDEAIKNNIRDAVEFGPFLIVNGKASFIRGNGGWGTAPRSAIAQRKDGIVLFLVMDGRDYAAGIPGADMVDVTELLQRYGAYNAANLDGGTSSGLVIDNKLINKPVNALGQTATRAIPTAWIVTK